MLLNGSVERNGPHCHWRWYSHGRYWDFTQRSFYPESKQYREIFTEACDIDGANWLQRLLYVTIPMLKETFIINIVLVVTGVFKIYELVYQMTGGGPAHQSELLTSYMYFTVFTSRRYGYGMAIAIAILLLSILGAFSYIKITTRKQRS